jgi:hypothetical protein
MRRSIIIYIKIFSENLTHEVRNKIINFEFEVPTAVNMKSSIIWDITPCGFGEKSTYVSAEYIASNFRVEE